MHDSLDKISLQAHENLISAQKPVRTILVLFGTRPEAIKLAPVIHELKKRDFRAIVVSSSQHKDLLEPFLKLLKIEVDYNLQVMTASQSPNQVCSRVLAKLDKILNAEPPDLILVQGDTTTTLAGALAGFNRRILVGHIEAGLRSGNLQSPFPEEMNRRLTSQLATFHFAATEKNRRNLLAERVPNEKVFVTGNTVVDSLQYILKNFSPSEKISKLIEETKGLKRILLTTHRRESFGAAMSGNLEILRDFVEKRKNVCLIFPVHPNPSVRKATKAIMEKQERVFLLDPLDYTDFVALMKKSWLIVSDSGGVQEEAPSLGKPLLIIRENTERPEAVEAKIAKLVGGNPRVLKRMLEENYAVETWIKSVREIKNPFGDGKAAKRIVEILAENLTPRRKDAKTQRIFIQIQNLKSEMNQNATTKKHLLTVLVEDYFHVGAFENLIQQRNWSNFEPRYEQNTLKTLDLLDEYNTKATFFVLGWIAQQNPRLISEIVARGHEIASRGFYHRSLRHLTPDEFREDLRKTNRVLEDASGQKIAGYRSAEKLSYEKDDWIFDILAEENFVYDASFLPSKKDAKAKRLAHQVHTSGKAIWEFPYSTRNVGLGLLPISGGNYFRQIPYTLMRHAVNDWHERYTEPFVLYFHVWELDPEQPRISAASRYNRIRHYRKLDKMEWVLKEYLQKYDFVCGAEFLGYKRRITNYELRIAGGKTRFRNPKSKSQNPKSRFRL